MGKQSRGEDGQNEALSGAKVAVLGYGDEAREQAQRLRAAGNEVAIGVRPGGMSWLRATEDGFAPAPTAAVVASADVVVVLVPEEDQPSVYWRAVAPNLEPGALVVFGRGQALHVGAVEPPGAVDFVLVTASATGSRGGAVRCRVAVHRDATGKALDRAIAYARAAFGEQAATLGTTTVGEEVDVELAAIESRAGGAEGLLLELDEMLARGTHEPDEAKLSYFERLRDHVARRAAFPRGDSEAPSGTRAVAKAAVTGVVPRPRGVRGVA